jgi:hypothetical protein
MSRIAFDGSVMSVTFNVRPAGITLENDHTLPPESA